MTTMRAHYKYPFLLVLVTIVGVAVFSLFYTPEQSLSIVLHERDTNMTVHVPLSTVLERCEVKERIVNDVWRNELMTYDCITLHELLTDSGYFSEAQEGFVCMTNIQGTMVCIPREDIAAHPQQFLFAVGRSGEDLAVSFSNTPEAGGPMRVLIEYDDTLTQEEYGPSYWMWCVYKISLVREDPRS
ncbi:hypothetical protein EF808_00785 [archaeon]|nr:MAG: hypothetical protein EF808_00785 [archaeon]